jgi:hypothetical protein
MVHSQMKISLSVLAFVSLTTLAPLLKTAAQTPNAAEPKMITTASGLKYVITSKGTGPIAQPGQVVVAHYVGTFSDGERFDSSRDRGEPFAFTLGQGRVIKGWDEGFALLRAGDKATFIIPPQLAYGDRQRGPIPANSTLHFDVEVLELKGRALSEALGEAFDTAGSDTAQRRFEELKATKFEGYFVNEAQLNGLGYARMAKGSIREAIQVFTWNVELFPGSANVYDSLGEAYARNGQRDLAVQSYEKSLALDSKNANAAKALAELKAQKTP